MAESRPAIKPHNSPNSIPQPRGTRVTSAPHPLRLASCPDTAPPSRHYWESHHQARREALRTPQLGEKPEPGPSTALGHCSLRWMPGPDATGAPHLPGSRDLATHHMGCHLPVFAQLLWLHQLLRHRLPSLRKSKTPNKSISEWRMQRSPFPRGRQPPPLASSPLAPRLREDSPSYAPW